MGVVGTVVDVEAAGRANTDVPERTVAIGAAAVFGGWALAAAVDPTHGPVLCPFRIVTGHDCPLCGATRAVHALATGHPLRALDHNLLVGIAVPVLLVVLLVAGVAGLLGRRLRIPAPSDAVWIGLAVVVLAFWVLRNLPGLAWLGSS
jgi:hypothetical protein